MRRILKRSYVVGLPSCPYCGHKGEMEFAAGRAYRLRCTNCDYETCWGGREQSILRWVNNIIELQRKEIKRLREE